MKKSTRTIVFLGIAICSVAICVKFYIERSIQSRMRSAADDIGIRYEPYYLGSDYEVIKDGPAFNQQMQNLEVLKEEGKITQELFNKVKENAE